MRKPLFETINSKIAEESDEAIVRLSATLRGREAEVFLRLHDQLGGPNAISRNDLASRILSHSLEDEQPMRRSRKAAAAETAG